MNVMILSKALIIGTYQRKLELLAEAPDVTLAAVVPPYWREPRVGVIQLERSFVRGYRLIVRPIALNGRFHLYFWPSLKRLLLQERPDVLHIDEESFNLATFQAMRLGRRMGMRCLFFNWANIDRRLPPPFSWMERYNLTHAAAAVAGNRDAAEILQRRGYAGPLRVIPQFGVDAEIFSPRSGQRGQRGDGLRVGYIGRLVPQKGILDLLEAAAGLPDEIQLLIAGSGTMQPALQQRVAAWSMEHRVTFRDWVPSPDMPELYRSLDVVVLPSRTRPNWKEQFGRVLIEAMACGVPVVGSDSGEIPHVIGEAGLTFPEGNVAVLRGQLEQLWREPGLREELGRRGRERALEHYTQERVAEAYLDLYRDMVR